MNADIYARYSSHNQTEQSIEGQLRDCYEYAKRNDLTIIGEYIDRAISGKTDERPDFQRMIKDACAKVPCAANSAAERCRGGVASMMNRS